MNLVCPRVTDHGSLVTMVANLHLCFQQFPRCPSRIPFFSRLCTVAGEVGGSRKIPRNHRSKERQGPQSNAPL
jgi:hypothetical protein